MTITDRITLDEWKLTEGSGHTELVQDPAFVGMTATGPHNAVISKTVVIGKAKSIWLRATAHRSDPANSDIQVGLENSFGDFSWGNWTGRGSETTTPVCMLEESNGIVVMHLRFAGEWGIHACKFTDIELAYTPVQPEPDPNPPERGIPGMIADIARNISAELAKIQPLLDEWNRAQAWIDEYNRNKGV